MANDMSGELVLAFVLVLSLVFHGVASWVSARKHRESRRVLLEIHGMLVRLVELDDGLRHEMFDRVMKAMDESDPGGSIAPRGAASGPGES